MDALQMAGIVVAIAVVAGLPQHDIGRFLAAACVGAAIGGAVGFALAVAAIMLFCPNLDSAGVGAIAILGAGFAGAVLGGCGGAVYAATTGPERESAVSAAVRSEVPERIPSSRARPNALLLVLAVVAVFAVIQVISQRNSVGQAPRAYGTRRPTSTVTSGSWNSVGHAPRAYSTPPTSHLYRVWTGPFQTQDTAREAAMTLAGRGFQAVVITTHNEGRTEYAVQLGAFADRNRAEATAAAVRRAGYSAGVF